MEDAVDGDADKRPPLPEDSRTGKRLPDSYVLASDHKSSVARRRRLEIRRLKYMSSFGRPDLKRLRSAVNIADSTTSTLGVATDLTVPASGSSCRSDLCLVARSISSLPLNENKVTSAGSGLSFVQLGMISPVRSGNGDELATASIGSNETPASIAASKNCSEQSKESHASPNVRCQKSTRTAHVTNVTDLEEPSRDGLGKHVSEDTPNLSSRSVESRGMASGSLEIEHSPGRTLLPEGGQSKQESSFMRAGSPRKQTVEQRGNDGYAPDRGGSRLTSELSAESGVYPPSSAADLPNMFSSSSVHIVPPDPESWEPCTGVTSIRGRRKEMEDAVTVVHRFLTLPCQFIGRLTVCSVAKSYRSWADKNSGHVHFFGVYDGHGGAQVAHHCREYLHRALAEEVRVQMNADGHCPVRTSDDASNNRADCWKALWEQAMNECFLRIDEEVGGVYGRSQTGGLVDDERRRGQSRATAPETVGSTAVVAVVSEWQIIVANCGDSRAVLSRGGQAMALSVDHKPEREDETFRIEAAGGKVIWWNGYRVFGMLAMSRAIGDRFLKPFVIADPEVICTERSEEDEFLILASDGLWDVLSNDEVCKIASNYVAGGGGVQAAAAGLTSAAYDNGSSDNITVVVVDLRRNRPCSLS